MRTRLEQMRDDAQDVGLWLALSSPGDGVTRYRFFDTPDNSYFGPANGIYTAMGAKEADTFLAGATIGYQRARDFASQRVVQA